MFTALVQYSPGQGVTKTVPDGHGGLVTTTWQQPCPQGNTIRDICFVDGGHGWAVGDHGTILRTTDGGESWQAQESGTTRSLLDCSFVNRLHGWVEGSKVLLRTTDGGATWTSTHAPPRKGDSDNIWGVATPSDGVVIVCTGHGRVWRSTDNGESWQQVHDIYDPYHVHFTDAQYGWVIGYNGRIGRSTDGGATWSEHWVVARDRAPLRYPHLLYFADSLRGWIGEAFDLYASTDGGRNWMRCCDSMGNVLGIAMTDSQHGWAWAKHGLHHTTNGGASWNLYLGTPQGRPELLLFVTPDSGWAAGYRGAMMRSTDGGVSWQGNLDQAYASFRAVQAPSPDTAWAVGSGIARTTDGGMNWLSLPLADSTTLVDAFFFDGRSGVCVGMHGLVLSTTDAGGTWAKQIIAPEQNLMDVFFLDRKRGWIATLEGSIFHTQDGGDSWQLLADGLPADLGQISFANAQTGHAACRNDGFWSTRDGGETWSSMNFGNPILDMALLDSSTIILLSHHSDVNIRYAALILRSTDGGATWRSRQIDEAIDPEALHFSDAHTGWLLAGNGSVWTTEDGGSTWTPLPTATGINGADITSPTPDRAFIVGHGIIRIDRHRNKTP